ncbi:hypothetical protein M011DRAFT_309124 [Sporormia fimetaria CBS 119925]|uniref:Uncharacterized protein n=1 Tax=Sporormia fimetaria CBS 119925 TaxID=1340428 RepID=A0A6A6VH37_9PLEO|nr:hypothetical protein M011DRAFT_309124 [Sporormia fimetaria CBS 119925]
MMLHTSHQNDITQRPPPLPLSRITAVSTPKTRSDRDHNVYVRSCFHLGCMDESNRSVTPCFAWLLVASSVTPSLSSSEERKAGLVPRVECVARGSEERNCAGRKCLEWDPGDGNAIWDGYSRLETPSAAQGERLRLCMGIRLEELCRTCDIVAVGEKYCQGGCGTGCVRRSETLKKQFSKRAKPRRL